MATPRMKRRIKREFSMEKPTIRIGKAGISQQVLGEIEKQLDKNEVVKIKVLKSALQIKRAKEIAFEVADKTNSTLIEVRGHTFTLYRRKTRKQRK